MERQAFELPGPLDLSRTLGPLKGGGVLPRRLDEGRIALALPTPVGAATLALEPDGDALYADAWGPGAEWGLGRVPRLLGLDDDPTEFDPPDRLLRDLHRQARGMRLGSTGLAFAALVPTVLAQKVTSKEAHRSLSRLVSQYGEDAPGPDAAGKLLPTAERVAALSYEDLHPLGIERRRALTLIEVARRARRLQEAMSMPPADARRRLGSVSGVGPWTVENVMGVAYGDRDAVPIGDYHLPNTVSWALAGEPRGDDRRMLELLEPYRPQRRRVVILLKSSGVQAPRYGPKSAIRSIERI